MSENSDDNDTTKKRLMIKEDLKALDQNLRTEMRVIQGGFQGCIRILSTLKSKEQMVIMSFFQ